MKNIRVLRFSVLAAALGAAISAHAGLFGSTLDTNVYYPNTSTAFATGGTAVVGSGVEYSDLCGFKYWSLDFTDTTVTVTMLSTTLFNSGAQLGPGVAVVNGPAIKSASFLSGHALTGITVENGRLFLNYSGTSLALGEKTVIGITTQAVPEPTTLVTLGLGAVAALRRRKRA